ncbi:MAG: hypothetical protein HOQ43_21455 [Glycomyces artemisiae]|uniref:Uncharacterized protein n=1 Tax=Glycomyces artemisiae TaxID=1076443 RepID=A0A850CGJ8_9ACTN|nr:hypothetical protein [Glycomyces artemisiae]
MFEYDDEFSPKSAEELRAIVENPSRSVVYRGRSIAALGLKAKDDPSLVEELLKWASDPGMRRTKWYGGVTLAWVAALAVGFSQTDTAIRQRLSQVLATWDPRDVAALRSWSRSEPWLDAV